MLARKDSKLVSGNGNPNLIINQGMSDISQDSVVPWTPNSSDTGPRLPSSADHTLSLFATRGSGEHHSISTLHTYDGSKKPTANSYLCPKGHETAFRSLPLDIIVQHRAPTRSNPKLN